MAAVCGTVQAKAYRAHAIRPCKWRKTESDFLFPNTRNIISDAGKTMSYVGKIMSDVIQITSDLFSPLANL